MRYKLFGRTGLRVSELCLGAMTFGTEWGWGSDPSLSRAVFEAFAEAGGNFIDTANFYTNGSSERMLGEFVRSERDRFVLATKYGLTMDPQNPNGGGNQRKSMMTALESSLRRLGTDYIDVYWLHVWDGTTAIDEVLRALDAAVTAGKVLHVGVSDAPAWTIARANTLAELRGWSAFAGVQAEYSLVRRDAERELWPMCGALGLTPLAWSPLGNGVLTGKYNAAAPADGRLTPGSRSRNRADARSLAIAGAVVEAARALHASPAQVAIAWVRRWPGLIPLIGARTPEQLRDNLAATTLELPESIADQLAQASQFELGFPHDFLRAPFTHRMLHGDKGDAIDGLVHHRHGRTEVDE